MNFEIIFVSVVMVAIGVLSYMAGFVSGRIDALIETRDWLLQLSEARERFDDGGYTRFHNRLTKKDMNKKPVTGRTHITTYEYPSRRMDNTNKEAKK